MSKREKLDHRQGHFGLLAPGQGRHLELSQPGPHPQAVEDLVDAGVEVGRPQGVEPLQGLLVPAVGGPGPFHQTGRRRGQLVLGGLPAGPSHQGGPDRLAHHHLVLLGQVAAGGRGWIHSDPAPVGLDDPGQQLQQGRLAHPVGPHHSDAALRPDGQGDVVEDGAPTPVMGQVTGHQRGRGGRTGR